MAALPDAELPDLLASAVAVMAHQSAARPEPAHLVLRCYLLGALSTLLVLALRTPLESLLLGDGMALSRAREAFLLTAPLEEICKLAVVAVAVAWHRAFDEILDGIVYGACAALGFATVENLLYVFAEHDPALAALRGFTATLAHVASSGIAGLGLAVARTRHGAPGIAALLLCTLCAILLHGAYDFGLALPDRAARAALVVVLPLTFVVLGLALRTAQASGRRCAGMRHSR